jgi:hypothetical protein
MDAGPDSVYRLIFVPSPVFAARNARPVRDKANFFAFSFEKDGSRFLKKRQKDFGAWRLGIGYVKYNWISRS